MSSRQLTAPADGFTNFLGQEINVGDTVAYPAMSRRSAQLSVGVLLSLEVRTEAGAWDQYGHTSGTWEEAEGPPAPLGGWHYSEPVYRSWEERPVRAWVPNDSWRRRIGEPVKAKVGPLGRNSRWRQHSFSTSEDGTAQAVTLTANAPSLVLIK